MATLHQVDCVEEDQVTRDHQQEEHLSRTVISSWENVKRMGEGAFKVN